MTAAGALFFVGHHGISVQQKMEITILCCTSLGYRWLQKSTIPRIGVYLGYTMLTKFLNKKKRAVKGL
jgi:hypothetical protein